MPRHMHSDYQVKDLAPQYSIYAYNSYCADRFGHNQWRCLGHMATAEQALEQAKKLFQTKKFAKIEIKKKFFDSKKNRNFVSTLQVLEHREIPPKMVAFSGCALIFSVVGLLLLEFL